MKYIIQLILLAALLSSCGSKEWKAARQIDLGDAFPVGIATDESGYWISDGNNSELLHFDYSGNQISKMEGFERPMHISSSDGKVYVPEYGMDQVTIIENNSKSILSITDSLDAPGGIHVDGKNMAIADFYNHRILLNTNGSWESIGKEGNGPKDFKYPTDVQFFGDKLFVADAYNNRIKVLDLSGVLLNTFGQEEEINAAIGIFVSDKQIFVMDQENDRVLIYDHNGKLLQILEEGFDKPIDAALVGNELFVLNFGGNNIQVLK